MDHNAVVLFTIDRLARSPRTAVRTRGTGKAPDPYVSCLAEQAKILVAEAEENNWDNDRFMPRWRRWEKCSLCEQKYHGVVRCALGWACWKTYVGRPETDWARSNAMTYSGD